MRIGAQVTKRMYYSLQRYVGYPSKAEWLEGYLALTMLTRTVGWADEGQMHMLRYDYVAVGEPLYARRT